MTADPTIDPGTADTTGNPAREHNRGAPDPERLLQLGLAFWGSKALLSAVELGLFSELAGGPLATEELTGRLGLHPRAARDFFDALVALGVLDRGDDGYHNTAETDAFLDRAKPGYIGGLFEMANDRLYGFWGSLTEGLRTGSPQNEVKSGGNFFEVVYQDPTLLRLFLQAMTGVSMGAARRIAEDFPWHRYRTVIDIGCAQGCVPVQLANRHARHAARPGRRPLTVRAPVHHRSPWSRPDLGTGAPPATTDYRIDSATDRHGSVQPSAAPKRARRPVSRSTGSLAKTRRR
ncbi:MAG TPA: methyltransferase dimerization domain-containing protein [Pseudonocardia sp.]|jgi:hypothetical protein|nr:methyltransferase dimerization domain-containing protein [Pseudonocardia sp.]